MKIKLITSALLLALLAACASTPPNQGNEALQAAVAAVAAARANQNVHKYAAVQLEKAENTLSLAQKNWETTHDETSTVHFAYMAKQRAEIAMAVAAKGVAQEQIENASATRKDVLIDELQSQLANMEPKQTDKGIVLTLNTVLFALDSAVLKPQAGEPLDKLAQVLQEHPDIRVRIEGYTDSTGAAAYNQQLSQRRAQSVADAMTQRGISVTRMTVIGYGANDPIASNATEFGRQQNRRVEFVILNRSGENVTNNAAAR